MTVLQNTTITKILQTKKNKNNLQQKQITTFNFSGMNILMSLFSALSSNL